MKSRFRVGLVLLTYLGLLLLNQGCKSWFESIGEKAARIVAEDVLPKLTEESGQWRNLLEETRDKIPEELRHEFDLAFQRAIDAAGTEFRCGVEFIHTRLRQDLETLSAKWLGQGGGPSLEPHFCSIRPGEVIALDGNDRPKDQAWLVFVGYDFSDYDNQLLVRVWLENTDGQMTDITNCCLDNPTHYNLTVDFDEITFTPDTRRLVLMSPGGEILKTVGINHAPPEPVAPAEESGKYIVNVQSGKCIDVQGDPGIANEARLQLWDCEFNNPATDQKWKMIDGFIQTEQGKCLDVEGVPGVENGAKLQLWDCEFGDLTSDQRWQIIGEGFIQNQYGRCLDVQGTPGTENGTDLQIWDCEFGDSQTDQRWFWK